MIKPGTIQKLCLLALYTSPVIGLLIVSPNFIANPVAVGSFPVAILFMSLLVLFIWAVNILLTWLIKKRDRDNNTFRYLLSYLMCVGCTVVAVQFMFFGALHNGSNTSAKTFHYHLFIFLSINTVVLVLQSQLLVKQKNIAIEDENARLKLKNIEAINSQLKQQVQPHFLFNSLSTLKALIKTSPAIAEDYLVRLSDFLRYAVSSGRLNTVLVAEEVKLCVDYLEMQKIRFGSALQFTINIPEDIQQQKHIPTFALQMLAENAIKHNMLTVEMPLIINIEYANLKITVSNNLQPNNTVGTAVGMGLQNLGERYKILSGDDIMIEKNDTTFTVSIKVLE